MIKATLTLSFFVLLAGSVAQSAIAQEKTMYSYTDENGTVVFTDKKPVGQDYEQQAVPPGPPRQGGNPYAPDEPADGISTADQVREDIARGKKEAQQKQAQQEAQCAEWTAEVERLEPNRRVFYENEQGETVRMDDVERVNRVADLKDKIAADCN